MRTKTKLCVGVITITAIIAVATIAVAIRHSALNNTETDQGGQDRSGFEMVIPDEASFLNAPPVETDEVFDVSFSYNDAYPPKTSQGTLLQTIEWTLRVFPKEGQQASDVYCTLILNDWILERSSSPSLKYMGSERNAAGDIPAKSKGIEAIMQKYVDVQTLDNPSYEEAMTSPVKIMLAYDGLERYYVITPTRVVENLE